MTLPAGIVKGLIWVYSGKYVQAEYPAIGYWWLTSAVCGNLKSF